jgi:hypothetical protein
MCTDAPTECDHVQTVVVMNGVQYKAHKDYGELAVKCLHYMRSYSLKITSRKRSPWRAVRAT